jgi:uroporphyrin-III C-methyltransferase/precorrin-2 dehydrogenase/sirohydrochlorin ferrochelatase
VSLVGAGPGDPGLLTYRAVQRLQQADLVLYDGLVPRPVLRLAGQADRVSVARRAGRRDLSQAAVIDRMIEAALDGSRVVRLKSGDPFVLGRGGEEAQALAAAGIDFEVVPGISSAIAAPALAGIPVTHRGLASAFVVVSGHDADAYGPVLGALPAGSVTVVVLMGIARRAGIARVLLEAGWPDSTPAAAVFSASQPTQFTWIGQLGELADPLTLARRDDPGVLVIGEVVSLAGADRLTRVLTTEEIPWQPMTTRGL